MRADWVRVDVVAVYFEIRRVFDAAFRKAVFPDRPFGSEAEGESAFDELHRLLDGGVGRGREEEMDVIGHEDEGVELVASFGAVVMEKLDHEVRVRVGLEEAAALCGDGGDEEGADLLWSEFGHEVDGNARRRGKKDYGGVGVIAREG